MSVIYIDYRHHLGEGPDSFNYATERISEHVWLARAGQIVLSNLATVRECLQRDGDARHIVHPDDWPRAVYLRRVMVQHPEYFAGELRVRYDMRDYRSAVWCAVPVVSSSRQFLGHLGVSAELGMGRTIRLETVVREVLGYSAAPVKMPSRRRKTPQQSEEQASS